MDYSSDMRSVLSAIEGVDRRSRLMFAIFVFFIMATAVFLITRINNAISQIEEIANESPYSRARQMVRDELENNVDTSSWKTYRNEKYGFEVKYARDAVLRELSDTTSVVDIGVERRKFGISLQISDAILAVEALDYDNTKNWCSGAPFQKDGFIMIDGKSLQKCLTPDFGGTELKFYTLNLGVNNRFFFVATCTKKESVECDQILSTFKFIQ